MEDFDVEENIAFLGFVYGLKITDIKKNTSSTVGNVYNVITPNGIFFLKIYNSSSHVEAMVKLHNDLLEKKFHVPKII